MKKLVSILIVMTLFLTMIPFGMLSASAEDTADWDYCIVRDFDQPLAPSIKDTNVFNEYNANFPREFVDDHTPDGTKWTVKLTNPAAEGDTNIKNLYFKNLSNADYTENAGGYRMWIANPSDETVCINWNYTCDNKTSTIGTKKAYYLQSENSDKVYKISTRTATNDYYGAIEIPANFEGWIYVPFSSGSVTSLNDAQHIRLYLIGNATEDVILYTSRIEKFNKTAVTLATAVDFAFDTLLPDSTDGDFSSKKVVAGSGTCAFALDETVFDGESGQSVKVKYSSGSTPTAATLVNFALVGFCTSLANDTTGDGFSFWVKNSESVDVKLTVTVAGYNNINKTAPYYLKPDGGEAYTALTVSSTKETTRSAIVIPANFEGKVYLPYTTGGSKVKSSGNMVLMGNLSASLPEVIMNFDSFRTYDAEEIGAYSFMTFDNITDPSTYMWNHTGISEITTEVADGDSGKSIKTTLKTEDKTPNLFRSFATANAHAADYNNSLGYKIWVNNPNNYDIYAYPQFTQDCRPAVVGNTYYLVTECGITGHRFKSLYTEAKDCGCVTLPAGFEGYIYIPKDSINFGSNVSFDFTQSSTVQFRLNFLAVSETGAVYLDSIGLYTAVDELVDADLNGDSEVNILDLVRLKKYSTDLTGFINELCLDVDSDGEINLALELVQLRKILLGVA